MKLVVPYIDKLQPVDARLIRLAEFLGLSCEPLPLAETKARLLQYPPGVSGERTCLVVNPRVIQDWVKDEGLLLELVSFLAGFFSYLLVHAPHPSAFDASIISALSGGSLQSVQEAQPGSRYEISPDSRNTCGAFAGLSFGPVDATRDCVFSTAPGSFPLRRLISIGNEVLMAAVTRGRSEVLFVGGAEVADLNTEVGDEPLTAYFSSLLPHAMALRYIFGEESWRPCTQNASIIIDDPLLRPNYGFLNFEYLLGLMKRHNFQTTVAFIPHNFRRNSRRVTRMFRGNDAYFGLCFHGNDHTGGEFASTDTALLNTMLHIAEQRMKLHRNITGLECDRIMVFPQGRFSVEAMAVLRSRNFDAAVNTVSHPRQQPVRFTLGEVAQPAVLRYAGFPLFLRKDSLHTQSADIAFNLFFGRPTFIVEHHDVFQNPQSLLDVASRINAAQVQWSSPGTAVNNAVLRRRATDGSYCVRAYSRRARVFNDSDSLERFVIEWKDFGPAASVESVLIDGKLCNSFLVDEKGIRLSVELPPRTAATVSVVFGNSHTSLGRLGFQRTARAFLRRRLSEVRDNYVAKNPSMMAAARVLRQRFVH